jgi:hypothetical protein
LGRAWQRAKLPTLTEIQFESINIHGPFDYTGVLQYIIEKLHRLDYMNETYR